MTKIKKPQKEIRKKWLEPKHETNKERERRWRDLKNERNQPCSSRSWITDLVTKEFLICYTLGSWIWQAIACNAKFPYEYQVSRKKLKKSKKRPERKDQNPSDRTTATRNPNNNKGEERQDEIRKKGSEYAVTNPREREKSAKCQRESKIYPPVKEEKEDGRPILHRPTFCAGRIHSKMRTETDRSFGEEEYIPPKVVTCTSRGRLAIKNTNDRIEL